MAATLAAERVAHAYLITGPARIGKRTLARLLAAALICPQAACGTCRACRLIAADTHPDVRIVEPEGSRRGVTIDQVRQLEHDAALKPYESTRKAFILRGVDAMTEAAANALLKTLEEPPDDTVLILTATDPSLVLPTIASRCREVGLRPVALPEIAAALVARGSAPEDATLLARLSGGRPGWALEAAGDPSVLEARRQQVETLEMLARQPRVSRLTAAATFGEAAATRDTLDLWLTWWRDALLVQQGCDDLVANVDRLDALRRIGASHAPAELWRAIARVQEARQQIDANANVRLVVEALLLDLPASAATT